MASCIVVHKRHVDFTFPDLDVSYLQEKVMTTEEGLTQRTSGQNLVIQVENPMPKVLLPSKNHSFLSSLYMYDQTQCSTKLHRKD